MLIQPVNKSTKSSAWNDIKINSESSRCFETPTAIAYLNKACDKHRFDKECVVIRHIFEQIERMTGYACLFYGRSVSLIQVFKHKFQIFINNLMQCSINPQRTI